MFDKVKSIKVSERVFDILSDYCDILKEDDYHLDAYLSTFNNCREQGYYLTVSDCDYNNTNRVKDNLYIWVYECRNSDDIMVVIQKEEPTINGMFSKDAWYKATSFNYNQERNAAEYIILKIKEFFNFMED